MNEDELGKMVIRLIGDGASYASMMTQAATSSGVVAKLIEKNSTVIQGYTGTIQRYADVAAAKLSGLKNTVGGMARMGLGSVGAGMLPGLLGLGGAMAGIGGMAWGVQLAGQAEQAAISFEVMLGDANAAKAMLAELTDFAAKTPFEMPGLRSAAQMMLQFGVAQNKIMPTLKALGDVAAGDQNKLNGLTYAYSQMQAAGRLMGQDLNQMINWGFNPLQEIARKTGKSMGQLRAEMEGGRISAKMVEEAFISATGPGGKFNGMMQRQSETIEGLRSTLADTIKLKVTEIGQTLIEKLNIKGFMKQMIALAEKAGPIISATFTKVVDFIIPVVSKIASAIGWVFNAVKPYFIMLADWGVSAFNGLAKTFGYIQKAIGPVLPYFVLLKSYILELWTALQNWISGNSDFLTNLGGISAIIAAIGAGIVLIPPILSAIGLAAFTIVNPFTTTLAVVTGLIYALTKYTKVGQWMAGEFKRIFAFMREQFTLLLNLIRYGKFKEAWAVITTSMTYSWDVMIGSIKKAWINTKDFMARVWIGLQEVLSSSFDKLVLGVIESLNWLIDSYNSVAPEGWEMPRIDDTATRKSLEETQKYFRQVQDTLAEDTAAQLAEADKPANESLKAWQKAQAEANKAVIEGKQREGLSFDKTWLGMAFNAASWAADQIQASIPQSTAAASVAGQMAGQAYNQSMGKSLSAIDAIKAGSTQAYELLQSYRSKFATPNNVNNLTQTGAATKETLPTLQGILTGINTLVTETKNKGQGLFDSLLSTAGLGGA